MSLMTGYLVDRMTVFHPTGTDDNGNPQGVTTENVPCLIEYGNRLIRGPTGDQVVSRALITTRHPVEVGDIVLSLNGVAVNQTIMDSRPISGLGGVESHREVYL